MQSADGCKLSFCVMTKIHNKQSLLRAVSNLISVNFTLPLDKSKIIW